MAVIVIQDTLQSWYYKSIVFSLLCHMFKQLNQITFLNHIISPNTQHAQQKVIQSKTS